MLRFVLKVAAITGVVLLLWHFSPWRAIRHPPGVLVAGDPVQTSIAPIPILVGDYSLEAVASYDITARVLSKHRYRSDRGADLVPLDVAVAWGRMSDQSVLDRLSISQGNRFYFYEWPDKPPIPKEEIVCHSANMHLIPANARTSGAIEKLRAGEVVSMHGFLVNATGPGNFHWNTSLSRTDIGNGACELMYVEQISASR